MGIDININKNLEKYIENFSAALHPVQKKIISYNEVLGNIKKMQVSVSQCFFLKLIIKISKAKSVLEIGTFTGLSTLSLALALPDNGRITSLDKNHVTNKKAIEFFKEAKQNKKINTIIKPALETLINLIENKNNFDLIFIDADKENYINYYESACKLVAKNGIIIIDNVLWYGKVADEDNNQKFTKIIRKFNQYVKKDKKTEQVILPLGDGLTVCRKL